MKIGSREFDVKNHTYVMGILNRAPDSFSDGGRYQDMDRALFQVERMLDEGMDILDIGGESTRPGYTRISPEEEIQRVVPVIEKVKERFEVPISLDTCKSQVALAGIRAGADMINDIWGLKDDGQMARVIAQTALPCCLMHNRKEAVYGDFVEDVITDLAGTLAIAEKAGIESDKIILDPGVGFGKTLENNLEIISKLERLRALGCPLLLGTSRKSVIGLTLNLPVQERVEGTLVTTVFAVQKGCAFVRVHDVRENVRTVRMTEALLGA